MPNLIGGLGAVGPSMAGQVCGVVSAATGSGCSNSYKSLVLSQQIPNANGSIALYDKIYNFDSCVETGRNLLPYGICVEYDKVTLDQSSGSLESMYLREDYSLTGVRFVDAYCGYRQKLLIDGSFSVCSQCPENYAGMGGMNAVLDVLNTAATGRGSMHQSTQCGFCVYGMYPNGGSCVQCPQAPSEWYSGANHVTSSDGHTCFTQAPDDGSDETGTFTYDTGITVDWPTGPINICYYEQ